MSPVIDLWETSFSSQLGTHGLSCPPYPSALCVCAPVPIVFHVVSYVLYFIGFM